MICFFSLNSEHSLLSHIEMTLEDVVSKRCAAIIEDAMAPALETIQKELREKNLSLPFDKYFKKHLQNITSNT